MKLKLKLIGTIFGVFLLIALNQTETNAQGTCSAAHNCYSGTCYCDVGTISCDEGYIHRITGSYPDCECECVPAGGSCIAAENCWSGTCYCDIVADDCNSNYSPEFPPLPNNHACPCLCTENPDSGVCAATLEEQLNLTTCLLDQSANGCMPGYNPVPYFNTDTTRCECYCLSPEETGTCGAIAQLYAAEWCVVNPIQNSCNDGFQAEAYSYYQDDGIGLDHCDCQCIPADAINDINWQDLLFCGGDRNVISTAFGCIPVIPRLFNAEFISRAAMMAGGIALLLVVFAGVTLILSSGNADRVASSAQVFKSALAGLLLIVLSIFVLRLLGIHLFNIPGI